MEDLIESVMKFGVDFGTRAAVKSVLGKLGADMSRADEVYVKIKNRLNIKDLAKVPYRNRALFLPHCMRSSASCPAPMEALGYTCKRCGKCDIAEIWTEAEKLGYRVYMVPGGSLIFKILSKDPPKAAVGVACYYELGEALEKLGVIGIPAVGVPLDKDGCKDTKVIVAEAIKVLRT